MGRLRLRLLLLLVLGGCGLFGSSPKAGFREYPLPGTSYEEAAEVVRTVTAREFTDLFGGGFTLDWDAEQGNLSVSPIYDDQDRRLRLYVKVSPRGPDTVLEMFALVEHLGQGSGPFAVWGRPMQDVTLEERLYQAYLVELLDRHPGGG